MRSVHTLKFLTILFLFTLGTVWGQTTASKPFARLDELVKQEKGGWAGSKQPFAKEFNAERQRLGSKFEPELLKYLGNDIEKYYWISSFLEAESYLQGNKPLPYLSLVIKQQGLVLCLGKDTRENRHYTVGLCVTGAVLCAQLGLQELAKSYKTTAETLLKKDDELKASFPAMYEWEQKLYDKIPMASVSK
jgi:hypothetical protein